MHATPRPRENAPVRMLLPPSESKRDGTLPGPVHLERLAAPELTQLRERALRTLAQRSARPTPAVREAIGVTARQDEELARNARVLHAPVAPAHAVYDGVLFDSIGFDERTTAQRRRIVERTLVQSALFGVVGYGDHIPAYRCSASSTLPHLGRMASFWRARIGSAMEALLADHLVLDMRSSAYAALWTPVGDIAQHTVIVRVMQVHGGRRVAVSHLNKATKGRLVRAFGSTTRDPTTADEVAAMADGAGYDVELISTRAPQVLEVLVT